MGAIIAWKRPNRARTWTSIRELLFSLQPLKPSRWPTGIFAAFLAEPLQHFLMRLPVPPSRQHQELRSIPVPAPGLVPRAFIFVRSQSAVVLRQRLQPLVLFAPHAAARSRFIPVRASVSGDGGVRKPCRSAHAAVILWSLTSWQTSFQILVEPERIELSTSGVQNQRSSQLSYGPKTVNHKRHSKFSFLEGGCSPAKKFPYERIIHRFQIAKRHDAGNQH